MDTLLARVHQTAPPEESFAETDYVVSNHFCLPLYFDLTDDQIDYVIDSLDKAVRSF